MSGLGDLCGGGMVSRCSCRRDGDMLTSVVKVGYQSRPASGSVPCRVEKKERRLQWRPLRGRGARVGGTGAVETGVDGWIGRMMGGRGGVVV